MKAYEVARYFLFLARDKGDFLTKLQIQKLLYFAQSYCLYYLKEPLFEDEIQAWKLGPVVPNVYYELKNFNNIVSFNILYNFSSEIFTDKQKTIIQMCYKDYGKYSPSYLVELTHKEESYKNVYEEGCNNIIPLECITKTLEKRDLEYLKNVDKRLHNAND